MSLIPIVTNSSEKAPPFHRDVLGGREEGHTEKMHALHGENGEGCIEDGLSTEAP